jgi:ABC-type antimicrobial peptide transport system permease subunit
MIGVLTGAVAAVPPIIYFYYHPIYLGSEIAKSYESYGYEAVIGFEPPGMYFIKNGLLVLLIVMMSVIFPLRKIFRLNIINALRNKL